MPRNDIFIIIISIFIVWFHRRFVFLSVNARFNFEDEGKKMDKIIYERRTVPPVNCPLLILLSVILFYFIWIWTIFDYRCAWAQMRWKMILRVRYMSLCVFFELNSLCIFFFHSRQFAFCRLLDLQPRTDCTRLAFTCRFRLSILYWIYWRFFVSFVEVVVVRSSLLLLSQYIARRWSIDRNEKRRKKKSRKIIKY